MLLIGVGVIGFIGSGEGGAEGREEGDSVAEYDHCCQISTLVHHYSRHKC